MRARKFLVDVLVQPLILKVMKQALRGEVTSVPKVPKLGKGNFFFFLTAGAALSYKDVLDSFGCS